MRPPTRTPPRQREPEVVAAASPLPRNRPQAGVVLGRRPKHPLSRPNPRQKRRNPRPRRADVGGERRRPSSRRRSSRSQPRRKKRPRNQRNLPRKAPRPKWKRRPNPHAEGGDEAAVGGGR